jgi:hypothetical protein
MKLDPQLCPALGASLLKLPLPSLRQLEGVSARSLASAGNILPAVEKLEVDVEANEGLPTSRGLPAVRRLTVGIRAPLAAALEEVERAGLLPQLESLELRGTPSDEGLAEALRVFAALPGKARLMLRNRSRIHTQLCGARARPRVRLALDVFGAEKVLPVLEALPVGALAAVHLGFAPGGLFRRRPSGELRLALERVVARWGAAGTVGWVQQSAASPAWSEGLAEA